MKNTKKIIPLHNIANEMFQPVRLHYNILKKKEFFKTLDNIKCIDDEGEFRSWFYSDEMLHTKYKIDKPTSNNEFWIIGRIQITDQEMLLTVNSIERAEAAMVFFDKRFSRKTLYLESLDIYNKLSEHKQENLEFYKPLEKFFVNKPIKKNLSESEEDLLNSILHTMDPEKSQFLLFQFMEITKTKQHPEYENFKPTFYDDGIDAFRTTFIMHQRLAYEHLIGNTNMTMYDLIEKIANRS